MELQNLIQETKMETYKGGAAIGGAALSAFTLNDWVALLTVAYIILQIGLLLPKYFKIFKNWKNDKN